MAQEKTAVDSFLSETNEEKSPFAEQETTIFSDKVATTEPESEEEVVDEKPLPFHKDPKVQRYVEKQIKKALEGVSRPSAVEQFRQEVQDEEITLPESFVELIGNDTPQKQRVLKDFSKYLGSLEEKGAQKALQQLDEQAQAQRQEDVAAQEELDTAFEDIEETFGVDISSNAPTARKARTEFVDYVRKIAPKNEDGEVVAFPDLTAAFEEFQERYKRPANNSRAKELASRGMSRSNDTTAQPKGGGSWKDVERMFSKFG